MSEVSYYLRCPHCDKTFIAVNPSKVYCTPKCRMDFNNARYTREGTRIRPKLDLICQYAKCGRAFKGRKGQKFCHKSCKESAYIRK